MNRLRRLKFNKVIRRQFRSNRDASVIHFRSKKDALAKLQILNKLAELHESKFCLLFNS